MNETPRTVAVGIFVIGALIIAATAIIFALGTGFGSERNKVIMVFEGSVKGLNVGAPIALRGVQVGQVTNIELILESETAELIMLVEAEIRGETIRRSDSITENITEELISRGLRAQLNTQSLLTGLLYVQLDFHPDSAVHYADIDSEYLQIPTIPTELERLTRELESVDVVKLTSNLETIATGVASFVGNEDFHQIPGEIRETLAAIRQLSTDVQAQVASSGKKLDGVLEGADETFALANRELPELLTLTEENLRLLQEAIASFESGMQEFEGLVDYDSRTVYQLNQALKELAEAGRSLSQLAHTLEEQPEVLIRGRSEEE